MIFVNPYLEGDPDQIIPEEDLPFTRLQLPSEEEEVGSIRTGMYVPKLIVYHIHVSTTISTSMGCRYSRPAPYHDNAQVRVYWFPFLCLVYSFQLKMVKTSRSRHT